MTPGFREQYGLKPKEYTRCIKCRCVQVVREFLICKPCNNRARMAAKYKARKR